jgi:hypothetical protein
VLLRLDTAVAYVTGNYGHHGVSYRCQRTSTSTAENSGSAHGQGNALHVCYFRAAFEALFEPSRRLAHPTPVCCYSADGARGCCGITATVMDYSWLGYVLQMCSSRNARHVHYHEAGVVTHSGACVLHVYLRSAAPVVEIPASSWEHGSVCCARYVVCAVECYNCQQNVCLKEGHWQLPAWVAKPCEVTDKLASLQWLYLPGLTVPVTCVVIDHLLKQMRAHHHTPDVQHHKHAAPRHSRKKKCYTALKRLRRDKPLARERVLQPTHSGHAAPRQSKAPFRLYRLRRVVAIARDKQRSYSRSCKLKPAHIPHVMNKIVDDLQHNRTPSVMHKHSVYSQLLPLAESRLHRQAHADQHREANADSTPHKPSIVDKITGDVTSPSCTPKQPAMQCLSNLTTQFRLDKSSGSHQH